MSRQQRRVEVDVQPRGCPGQLPGARPRATVSSPQPLEAVGVTGDPVDHPKRRRARRDLPKQRLLIAERAQIGQAVAAVGEHHRQVTHDAAHVVAGLTRLEIAKAQRQRPRQPRLVGDLGQQRAARVRHQARSVRRHFYGYPAPIVRHLQGDPPESVLQASTPRRIPAQADGSAAPTIGAAAASCTIRANFLLLCRSSPVGDVRRDLIPLRRRPTASPRAGTSRPATVDPTEQRCNLAAGVSRRPLSSLHTVLRCQSVHLFRRHQPAADP